MPVPFLNLTMSFKIDILHSCHKRFGQIAAILLMAANTTAPFISLADEASASEKYLVAFETDKVKPALLYLEKYLKEIEFEEESEEIKGETDEKKISNHWEATFSYYRKDLYTSVFAPHILAQPSSDKWAGDLRDLSAEGDSSEGVVCIYDYEAERYREPETKQGIPLQCLGQNSRSGSLIFQAHQNCSNFSKDDWSRYLQSPDGEWLDPSIRKIWVTSWENISGRWNRLLEERNAKAVRRQIGTIVDSGRFKTAGGKAWHDNIERWWHDNAAEVVPKLVVVNYSGGKRAVRISWSTGGAANKDKALGDKTLDNEEWVPKTVPFNGIEDKREIKASVRYFMPGYECCGYREETVSFAGPFADDVQFPIRRDGTAPWEATDRANLEVTIDNIDKRKLAVSFKSGKKLYKMSPKLGNTDVWTCDVPAHTGGSVEVHDETAGKKTLLESLPIGESELHRGKTVKKRMILQHVVRKPELRCQKVIELARELKGEERDNALLKVEIEGDHAIFDGDKANYSNPQVLSNRAIHKSSESEIPVHVVLPPGNPNGGADRDVLDLAKFILEKHNLLEMKFPVQDRPATNAFISVPKQVIYIGNWEECKEFMNRLPSGQRGKILKALSAVKRSWDGLILEYVRKNDLLPTVRIWNNTGERVDLALGGRVFRMDAGEFRDVAIAGTGIPEIRVRKILPNGDEPLLDSGNESEYINNVISSKILKWPKEWGESIEYRITTNDIELKPAPVLVLSWPPDLTDVEVVAYGSSYSASGNQITIQLPRLRKLEDLVISSDNYEPYEPKISANLRYSGLRYGQTEKLVITADSLEEKPPPPPPQCCDKHKSQRLDENGRCPKCDAEPTKKQIDRLRTVLQNAVRSLDGSGNRETAEDNIREAMPGNNKTMKALMEDESNTDGDQVKAARSVLTNKLRVDADTVLRIWGWL